MNFRQTVVTVFALLPLCAAAGQTTIFFEDLGWQHLYPGQPVRVTVHDEVTDGCWRNPQAAKNAVELALKQNGYEVSDDGSVWVTLHAVGSYSVLCAVAIDFSVSVPSAQQSGTAEHLVVNTTISRLWSQFGVVMGSKANVNNGLRTQFVVLVEGFLNRVDKEQEKLFQAIRDAATGEDAEYWKTHLPE